MFFNTVSKNKSLEITGMSRMNKYILHEWIIVISHMEEYKKSVA